MSNNVALGNLHISNPPRKTRLVSNIVTSKPPKTIKKKPFFFKNKNNRALNFGPKGKPGFFPPPRLRLSHNWPLHFVNSFGQYKSYGTSKNVFEFWGNVFCLKQIAKHVKTTTRILYLHRGPITNDLWLPIGFVYQRAFSRAKSSSTW